MKNKSIVTVKEWIFDKVVEEARKYNITIMREYDENGNADHTKLRVEEVLAETEKAYKVAVDAETASGQVKTWTAWIPKSAVVA